MKLENILNVEKLRQHIREGNIAETHHPFNNNLVIYNYTHTCQFKDVWDEITTRCRGLIVDDTTNEVLARPFPKFFNLNDIRHPETTEENLPSIKPFALEKMDGSMGLYFRYAGVSHIATRGSFWSDQAKWATSWYREKELIQPIKFPESYTPIFEIIYKENRIVVDYDFEGLVLLGFVDIETGNELPPGIVQKYAIDNGFRCVKDYSIIYDSLEDYKSFKEPNKEGFVLQYWIPGSGAPLRIKVKTEEYRRLHKIITGTNPKSIWESLKNGYNVNELYHQFIEVNKPFADWVLHWTKVLQDEYDKMEHEVIWTFGTVAVKTFRTLNDFETKEEPDKRIIRKLWAMAIQQEPVHLRSPLFAVLSGQDYKQIIWERVKPIIQDKEKFINDVD